MGSSQSEHGEKREGTRRVDFELKSVFCVLFCTQMNVILSSPKVFLQLKMSLYCHLL